MENEDRFLTVGGAWDGMGLYRIFMSLQSLGLENESYSFKRIFPRPSLELASFLLRPSTPMLHFHFSLFEAVGFLSLLSDEMRIMDDFLFIRRLSLDAREDGGAFPSPPIPIGR